MNSKKHNILMVLSTKTFPPDGRVEREARDLIRDGHRVFLMARRGIDQLKEEDVNGVHVIRVPLPFQKKKGFADLIYFFLQRYFIFFHIVSACRKHKIDVLHLHDLPYALATTLAGKVLRIPVIFDMHEHYVAMLRMSFEARVYRRFKPFAFILLAFLKLDEKIALRLASKVIVVADEHIDRVTSCGARQENIIVVTNTEDIDNFSGIEIDESIIEKYNQDFVILYQGGFSPHRGIETAIEAMPAILDKIINARLLLVGDGCNRKELEELTEQLKMNDRVIFVGHRPFREVPTYIKLCHIGLIPHISTPHIETTMPNKIFQFMMLARPVVVSNTAPMMRIVNDAKCGSIFKERDPESLAETIVKLYEDKELRDEMGINGESAVKDRYNWHETVQALLNLYETL